MNILDKVGLWIVNVGEIVTPILLFLAGLYVSVKEVVNFFSKRKANKTMVDVKDLLVAIVNKDNCENAVNSLASRVDEQSSELKKVNDSLKVTQDQNILLGQMLATIFQYSSLPIETKEHLEALLANLEFNKDSDYMENLIKENQELRSTLETIKKETKKIAETSQTQEDSIHQNRKGYVQAV